MRIGCHPLFAPDANTTVSARLAWCLASDGLPVAIPPRTSPRADRNGGGGVFGALEHEHRGQVGAGTADELWMIDAKRVVSG